MKLSFLSLVAVSGLTAASPVTLIVRADRGSYTVSGLGSRKQQVLNAGGSSLDLAIAMLETDNMSTNYVYGDGKTQDAANFGIFKQNWGMLRECASRAGFKGQSQANWNNGAKLKFYYYGRVSSHLDGLFHCTNALHINIKNSSDLYADVASRWDCQNYYGYDRWFAGHRNGASGLVNPNTADINSMWCGNKYIAFLTDPRAAYKSAIQWIQQQIDSNIKYRSDDTRFWVNVTPI